MRAPRSASPGHRRRHRGSGVVPINRQDEFLEGDMMLLMLYGSILRLHFVRIMNRIQSADAREGIFRRPIPRN